MRRNIEKEEEKKQKAELKKEGKADKIKKD